MRDTVDGLIEAQRIRDCVVRGARGADRLDVELLGSVFWADARIRYGGWAEWSPVEFVDAWSSSAGCCVATEHYLFNHRLELDGDVAHVETYYIAVFVVARRIEESSLLPFCGAVAPGEVGFQGGRYVDRLERRDGDWRVARRQVCGDWFATADGARTMQTREAIEGRSEGASSRRDRHDPSYACDAAGIHGDHLDELLAIDGIRDCVFRYARAIDRLDMELLASAFVDMDDEGELIKCVFDQGRARPTHAHYITNLRASIAGASARAEAYFLSASSNAGRPDRTVDLTGGRYVLELIRTPDGWRISRRTMLGEWHAVGDGSHLEAFVGATGNKSRRSREDASYDPLVTEAVSRTLDDLLQREGVRDCLARYARGVDRLDRELIGSAFVEVAPQFVEYMFRQAEIRPVQNHYWTNLRIQLAGDVACIEAYYMSAHGYVDGASSGFIEGKTSSNDVNFVGGRYVRWFEKTEGGRWGLRNLSSSRKYPPPGGGLGDWHAKVDGSRRPEYLQATDQTGRVRGSRDDPSYAR